MFKPPAVDGLVMKLFSKGWRPEIVNGLLTAKSALRGTMVARFPHPRGTNGSTSCRALRELKIPKCEVINNLF